MLDITTIILTYNEEKHIGRCLKNVCSFSKQVYVVDSPSTDRTVEICNTFPGVKVVEHKYPGNQAAQFNWALDNIEINTTWILRLDADEYLSDSLISELKERLPKLPEDVSGCIMKRDVIFMGRRIRHGKIGEVQLLRLWRNGKARIEDRLMDEHAILTDGHAIKLNGYFFDENLNGIDAWTRKHLNYADRELKTIYATHVDEKSLLARDVQKSRYYSFPKYHRCFLFFVLRYVFLAGFLDGKAGFVWNFMQCWWYRTLIDIKIDEHLTGGGLE